MQNTKNKQVSELTKLRVLHSDGRTTPWNFLQNKSSKKIIIQQKADEQVNKMDEPIQDKTEAGSSCEGNKMCSFLHILSE